MIHRGLATYLLTSKWQGTLKGAPQLINAISSILQYRKMVVS